MMERRITLAMVGAVATLAAFDEAEGVMIERDIEPGDLFADPYAQPPVDTYHIKAEEPDYPTAPKHFREARHHPTSPRQRGGR